MAQMVTGDPRVWGVVAEVDGKIVAQEGNKLEIEFEKAGRKKVLDSFVSTD